MTRGRRRRAEQHQQWWTSLTEEERSRYRAAKEKEDRLFLFVGGVFLGISVLMTVAMSLWGSP